MRSRPPGTCDFERCERMPRDGIITVMYYSKPEIIFADFQTPGFRTSTVELPTSSF